MQRPPTVGEVIEGFIMQRKNVHQTEPNPQFDAAKWCGTHLTRPLCNIFGGARMLSDLRGEDKKLLDKTEYVIHQTHPRMVEKGYSVTNWDLFIGLSAKFA